VQEIRIRLLWHKQAQFAGFLVAEALGLGNEDGIAIRCEGPIAGQSPIEAVRSGAVHAAVASPAHVLESHQPDALRVVLIVQQASPLVYPVKATSPVRALADLSGRPVAVWPGNESLELRWMLQQAGVAEADFVRLETGDTVAALLEGRAAAAQMTTYHELHVAQARVGADGLRLFRATDEQALVKDGLVVSLALVNSEPRLVQALVDASMRGWANAFTDPDRAVAVCCAARPDTTPDEQRQQLSDIRDLSLQGATLTHGLGYPDPAHEARVRLALRETGHAAHGAAPITNSTFWQSTQTSLRQTSLA
jgi:NitT/TauT family transport system substrate-binding protein